MEIYEYEDIVRAFLERDYRRMNEATLMRLYRHYKRAIEDGGSFAIVTSWRNNLSPKENQERFRELEHMLRSWGYGFVKLQGFWEECQDPEIPYEKCPNDMKVLTKEPSLFVPDMKLDHLKTVIKKFDQDGAIYAGPETKGKVVVLLNSGKTFDIGSFHPNAIAQGWSKLKGRTFAFFEGFFQAPQSFTEAVLLERLRQEYGS